MRHDIQTLKLVKLWHPVCYIPPLAGASNKEGGEDALPGNGRDWSWLHFKLVAKWTEIDRVSEGVILEEGSRAH